MFQILVVDDHPDNLDLTSRILQKAGYGVATAASGEEGVKMASAWRYDLIVMDMAMPGISGPEAARKIRGDEAASGSRRVPVIAFTANAVEEFRQRAMRSDMDDFITKPIERRHLLAAVERSLDDRLVVLVADDRAADRGRTVHYLRELDRVAVLAVSSGIEAVAACARQRVTLAVINMSLPDISGIEAAHRIRSSPSGAGVAIIAVSDRPDPEARKHWGKSGFAGYLEKPVTQADILKACRTC
jgi:CheY-like chemotaxis protein